MQLEGKSQKEILTLLSEVLRTNYNLTLANCGTGRQRNFVYLDDGINTGKTVFRHSLSWLSERDESGNQRYLAVNQRTIRYIVSVFYYHSWAWANILWQFSRKLGSDEIMKRIIFRHDYFIENHIRFPNQRLNLPYPHPDQDATVKAYLQSLQHATDYEDRAYRNRTQPLTETFFSSSENRLRFENILLTKGITILSRVSNLGLQHRPLGDTYPHYKTFGTGTMYFTWRNISNTCPLVFWWDNPSHHWHALFPLRGRGRN